MDILDESLLKFWKSLNQHSVLYIMVGGFAVNMHGYSRVTGDVDIWLYDNKDNRLNFGEAMKVFGYCEMDWANFQFIPGWSELYLDAGVKLDAMTSMKGLENITFEEAYKTAQIANIEQLKVPFLHINQLIANKKAVNRPKDQVDVMELEKIIKMKNDLDSGIIP